jgi:uncharacterized protein (DUF1501 family)
MDLMRDLEACAIRIGSARALSSVRTNYERVFEMNRLGTARRAFALDEEPAGLRDAYGRSRLGQSCVLARRLVEAGVPFVVVDDDNWDFHSDVFPGCRKRLPELDRSVSTLIADLGDRGLLASTLLLVLTDFGRTPLVNSSAGRDHWPDTFSILAAGAGIPGGLVLGASDKIGARPIQRPVTPKDVAATIYHFLGIDPFQEYQTPEGRTLRVLDDGALISEWL